MAATKILLSVAPAAAMLTVLAGTPDLDIRLVTLAKTEASRIVLFEIGRAAPFVLASSLGAVALFACRGMVAIRHAGLSVTGGCLVLLALAGFWDAGPQWAPKDGLPAGKNEAALPELALVISVTATFLAAAFALRVAMVGNMAFASDTPRRLRGRRAVHGDAVWMSMRDASNLFPARGGIVLGERYRVDRQSASALSFRPDKPDSWGAGGKAPLLSFDCTFGSTHGVVFAGSGGFKTTSVTIPTALTWGSGLVVLDPSGEVASIAREHRRRHGRHVVVLDPNDRLTGFNALDWIGRFGKSKEEDIAAVATWIMTDTARLSARDDFFRSSALQLLTALIADVCLSGHTAESDQTLRQVRANLAEPEPKLRERLIRIHDMSASTFVRENVAPFIAMTPETFSGVYANAIKETHWLSYSNYAALVAGSSFTTSDLAEGNTDIFLAFDLKVLDAHPGLARVVLGSLLNAIYNRSGSVEKRTLFLLDEVARLGYMRILETARDAGRKYGITLVMIFQSLGQLREAYGGRDATSKWFESASWISFAAINDPDTAEYVSRRCGDTTVEVDQVSTSSRSRTRTKQLSRRALVMPQEVMAMRADEQIVFTAGNPPLRCGRPIWFRRAAFKNCATASAS
ncbi:Ti-type conjugative transfer system protein TraG [Aminobacter sp. DSM 101952]|uniref:Ti-type conjugative transfer system protein TraG n=1 Tax=Aminobacter sp. DSM 101952 TaxID=2735891 RepID=UPI0009EABCD4|nr:Ti-type conjugative transfer system protein TraG [Aminobacter sp. DSM 101952]